jgi:hypothetical protein
MLGTTPAAAPLEVDDLARFRERLAEGADGH